MPLSVGPSRWAVSGQICPLGHQRHGITLTDVMPQ